MYKIVLLFALVAVSLAAPAPKPKPQVILAAYTSPVVVDNQDEIELINDDAVEVHEEVVKTPVVHASYVIPSYSYFAYASPYVIL